MPIETETRSYTVVRDGLEDINFTGQLLASGTDHENQGPQNSRWSEVSIHKTTNGHYVVAQCFVARGQGEADSHRGNICESARSVYDLLAGNDEGIVISSLAKEALEEAATTDDAFEGMALKAA